MVLLTSFSLNGFSRSFRSNWFFFLNSHIFRTLNILWLYLLIFMLNYILLTIAYSYCLLIFRRFFVCISLFIFRWFYSTMLWVSIWKSYLSFIYDGISHLIFYITLWTSKSLFWWNLWVIRIVVNIRSISSIFCVNHIGQHRFCLYIHICIRFKNFWTVKYDRVLLLTSRYILSLRFIYRCIN